MLVRCANYPCWIQKLLKFNRPNERPQMQRVTRAHARGICFSRSFLRSAKNLLQNHAILCSTTRMRNRQIPLTVYDRATWSFIYSDTNRTTRSSYDIGKMKKESRRGMTLYVGPKAPDGLESNCIPTVGKRPLPRISILWADRGAIQKNIQDAGFRGSKVKLIIRDTRM